MDEQFQHTSKVPPYSSIATACELLGLSRSTLYELAARGSIRVIKVGGRSVVDIDRALAWMASLPPAQITTGLRKAGGVVPRDRSHGG